MDKAFDKILRSEVDAISLAKKTTNKVAMDYFRYQCLWCGEEVYLAAANSTCQTPHFRHKRGNNDTKCEEYLGQPGAIEKSVLARKHNREQVAFFFNNDRMTFEIGVLFTKDELEDFRLKQASIELKTKHSEGAFLTVPINSSAFIPDVMQFFTINKYAPNYILSIDDKLYSFYDIIKEKGKITFFKLRIHDGRAKKVSSDVLYTNARYLAICEEEALVSKLISFTHVESKTGIQEFTTMNKNFYAAEISITQSDYGLNTFLSNQDLRVDTSETLNILWPPVFRRDSDYICEGDKVYISSSFPLSYHGNTNAACKTDDLPIGITQIILDDKAVVYEKNIELSLVKADTEKFEIMSHEVESRFSSKWKVPGDMDYFLFDQDGCRKLIVDETVYLQRKDKIVGYKNGHIRLVVLGEEKSISSTENMIKDILKYHPQTEPYKPDDFEDLVVTEAVVAYLEGCYKTGKINTIIKKYIEEGLL